MHYYLSERAMYTLTRNILIGSSRLADQNIKNRIFYEDPTKAESFLNFGHKSGFRFNNHDMIFWI